MTFDEFVKRAHFSFGNVYRLITSPIYETSIHPDEACSLFGCMFNDAGWHHLRRTIAEYDENPEINYTETSLYSFLKNFRPNSISDLIMNKYNLNCDLPLFTYPWGTFKKGEVKSSKTPYNSRFCGPSSDAFIKEEFIRTINLYKKIQVTGYQPKAFGNTYIGGTLLLNREGKRRFVVLQGNHRMAILAHLGYKNIKVREVRGFTYKVTEKAIAKWSLVKSSECSKKDAELIFNMFFEETGYHVLNQMEINQNFKLS